MKTMELIAEASRGLQRLEQKSKRLPAQVAAIASALLPIVGDNNLMGDDAVASLLGRYRRLVAEWGMGDIATRQMEYARRIADHPSEILYEEMHKIFSLCDTIHALKSIGFPVDSRTELDFAASIKAVFRRHARLAACAAEDKVKPWNKNLWWYRVALGQTSREDGATGT